MTTAHLEILNDYQPFDMEYSDFREALARWACRWVSEVSTPIARNARALFNDRAVRALVLRWDKLETLGRDAQLRCFEAIADEGGEDCGGCPAIEKNTWEREAGELSQALYFLLVQDWGDTCFS